MYVGTHIVYTHNMCVYIYISRYSAFKHSAIAAIVPSSVK